MRILFRKLSFSMLVMFFAFASSAQVTPVNPKDTPRTREEVLKQDKTQLGKHTLPKESKEIKEEEIANQERIAKARKRGYEEVFPQGTVWLNTDFPVAGNMFEEKIMILVFSDFNCTECAYGLSELEETIKMSPAFQLIEVIRGDTTNPVSRNFILQYIQQYAFNHPIAIVSDYPGLGDKKVTALPSFAMFQKSKLPDFLSSGSTGLEEITKRIKDVSGNAEYIRSCNTYLANSAVAPHCWADPVVENPTYIEANSTDGSVFVNDAAHNRIVEFDKAGYCTRTIGSSYYGYADDVLANAKFDHPHGMCLYNGNLYIADTYNHRIRMADLAEDRVRTVLGNGKDVARPLDLIKGTNDPIGLPIDVVEWNGKLFLASGNSNRIYEFDPKSGEAKKFVDLNVAQNGMKRSTVINLSNGKNVLYAVMSDGSYIQIDKKGTQLSFPSNQKSNVSAVLEWNGELVGANNSKNRIILKDKDGWKSIAGSGTAGESNGTGDESSFAMPFDLTLLNGELIISDRENHRLRKLSSFKDGKVRHYPIAGTMEVVVEMAAHTEGEMVVMDTVYIGNNESTIEVKLDLDGYTLVASGRNEIDINDLPGAYIKDYAIKDDKFSFQVNKKFTGYDVYVEVYMLLENPEDRGVYIAKRAYLAFVVKRVPDAPALQEQLYSVHLLPQ